MTGVILNICIYLLLDKFSHIETSNLTCFVNQWLLTAFYMKYNLETITVRFKDSKAYNNRALKR